MTTEARRQGRQDSSSSSRREWWLEHEKRFWVSMVSRRGGFEYFEEVTGQRVRLPCMPEMDLFAHRVKGGWAVSCGVTGLCVSEAYGDDQPAMTIEGAVAKAEARWKAFVDKRGREHVRGVLAKGIEKSGLSPRYRWEDEEAE